MNASRGRRILGYQDINRSWGLGFCGLRVHGFRFPLSGRFVFYNLFVFRAVGDKLSLQLPGFFELWLRIAIKLYGFRV